MTAPKGLYAMKDPSDSSASTMKVFPAPWCALVPEFRTVAPIAKDGSNPQCCSATVNIEVVVVFP